MASGNQEINWRHGGVGEQTAKTMSESRHGVFGRIKGWIRENPVSAAALALTVAIGGGIAGGQLPPNTDTANQAGVNQLAENDFGQQEQTPPPILVFNGEFDVSSQVVDGFHVTEFGGTKVSHDVPYYKVPLGIIQHDTAGTYLVVDGIDPDGKVIPLRILCDPAAKVGGGPVGGATVGKEGTVVSSADATLPDGAHAKAAQLSNATPGFGSMPTPQP
jgi:hypothetical protein